MKDRKLIHNVAVCLKCNDEIESKHTHDYVTCSCGNISVDGGLEYARRAFQSDDWVDKSTWEAI